MISYIYRHSINKKKKNQEIHSPYEDFILILIILSETQCYFYDERRGDEICISNKHFYPNCYFSEGTVLESQRKVDKIIAHFKFRHLPLDD